MIPASAQPHGPVGWPRKVPTDGLADAAPFMPTSSTTGIDLLFWPTFSFPPAVIVIGNKIRVKCARFARWCKDEIPSPPVFWYSPVPICKKGPSHEAYARPGALSRPGSSRSIQQGEVPYRRPGRGPFSVWGPDPPFGLHMFLPGTDGVGGSGGTMDAAGAAARTGPAAGLSESGNTRTPIPGSIIGAW